MYTSRQVSRKTWIYSIKLFAFLNPDFKFHRLRKNCLWFIHEYNFRAHATAHSTDVEYLCKYLTVWTPLNTIVSSPIKTFLSILKHLVELTIQIEKRAGGVPFGKKKIIYLLCNYIICTKRTLKKNTILKRIVKIFISN